MTSFTSARTGIVAPPADWAPMHPNLAAALAAFQLALPKVQKGAEGQVKGRREYRYADLADVTEVVLPALGAVGLCFTAYPTLEGDTFGLSYSLQHEGGEHWDGFYPLPDPRNTGAQDLGSAITYARRYALNAVVGIAPDEDDDGNRAQQHHERERAPQRRLPRAPDAEGAPYRDPEPEPGEVPEYVLVRGLIADWVKGEYLPDHVEQGFTDVARAFHALYGTELGQETSVHRLTAVLRTLKEQGLAGLLPRTAEQQAEVVADGAE